MDPYERSQVADALLAESFVKGDVIIKEGDIGDKFYMIIEGEAIAMKKINGQQKQVFAYKGNDYFGERALLTNDARAASIIVTSEKLTSISLDRETFKRLLGPLEDILSRNMDIYNEYGGAKKLHPHHQANPGAGSMH
jgi:cAMP-dependent protein kinase regulator